MNRIQVARGRGFRRVARCGHEVEYHPGPARKMCPACAEQRSDCVRCGADMRARPRQARYCSRTCSEIANGQRRAGSLEPRQCALEGCARLFQPASEAQSCCSEQHGKRHYNRLSRSDGRQPAAAWNERRRQNHEQRKRRLDGGKNADPHLLDQLTAAGEPRCGICHDPIDLTVRWPDLASRSIDHIVPISRGGAHERQNVQLTHLGCNLRKGTTPG